MTGKNIDTQLVDLEQRLTFIDDAVSQLVDADATQSRRLLRLERAVASLTGEIASLRTAVGDDARNEPPPPHY